MKTNMGFFILGASFDCLLEALKTTHYSTKEEWLCFAFNTLIACAWFYFGRNEGALSA